MSEENKERELMYEAFNKSGWEIECEHPLEVSYEENFAKHSFANIVIEDRVKDIIDEVVSQEIANWHLRDENDSEVQLHEYLDYSWDEYQLYARHNIVPSRKKNSYLKKFISNPSKYLDNL